MSQAIERLQKMPREMTSEQAGYVLDRSSDFIKRAINSKPAKLEARGDSGRGTGANLRYYISREALLTYIVRNTGGDRFTLLRAIRELLPAKLHELALQVAAESTAEPVAPSWIISSKQPRSTRAARVQSDPFAGHPDFFRTPAAD
jgi:hypothetical protein